MLRNSQPQVLYGCKAYKRLGKFADLLRDFEKRGRAAPCCLKSLGRFAKQDLGDATAAQVSDFSFGDVAQTVRVFASPLYRDFLETRAGVLLHKLPQASSAAERETCLRAFCQVAATIDGERSSQGDRLIEQTSCISFLRWFIPTPKL